MRNIFENFRSLVFTVILLGGYFPANMILAYIYGDKTDVVISFFIPFYGYVVLFLGN